MFLNSFYTPTDFLSCDIVIYITRSIWSGQCFLTNLFSAIELYRPACCAVIKHVMLSYVGFIVCAF